MKYNTRPEHHLTIDLFSKPECCAKRKHPLDTMIQALALFSAVFLTVLCLCLWSPFGVTAQAADPTDEIEHFIVTVDVQEDASLQMTYHIDWRVLDDEKYGPLTWVDIGVPNSHHFDVQALGSTISKIEDKGSSLAVYLDREYHEGELASFEFSFVQDHMYQIDRYVEGETVFAYTPAWFDGIEVKDLTIRWNADRAGAWQPDCLQDGGYLVFSTSLSPGGQYTMNVVYPNDAFGFSEDRQADGTKGSGGSGSYEDDNDPALIIAGLIGLFIFFVLPIMLFVRFIRWILGGTGFGGGAGKEKKIVRTKIEYFANCPGCGATREEGKDKCPYCGRSMIKSKEIVEEKDIEKPEAYRKAGTYRYGNAPNTYIHVHVVPVPVSRSSSHRSSGGSRGSGRSSSCASSCACASHCACASSCACACACASSGRAGCSVKEFFAERIHSGRVRVESKG